MNCFLSSMLPLGAVAFGLQAYTNGVFMVPFQASEDGRSVLNSLFWEK